MVGIRAQQRRLGYRGGVIEKSEKTQGLQELLSGMSKDELSGYALSMTDLCTYQNSVSKVLFKLNAQRQVISRGVALSDKSTFVR